MKVLVFKTTVRHTNDVEQLSPLLNNLSSITHWSFDLEDSDNILRVESPEDISAHVKETLALNGFGCEELID